MIRGKSIKAEVSDLSMQKPVDATHRTTLRPVTSSATIRRTTRDRIQLVDVSFPRDARTWVVVCVNHRFVKLDIE
jgi:hypothetical protein